MRTFFVISFLVFLTLAGAAIGIEVAVAADPSAETHLQGARTLVHAIGGNAWQFLRPLLQLITVLFIVDWLATRLGFKLTVESLQASWGTWSVQAFIAGIIITTYCIAVLADIAGANYLKDVVLIVIGFYFGTRAKVDTGLVVTAPDQAAILSTESTTAPRAPL